MRKMPLINAPANVFSEARGLKFWFVHESSGIVYTVLNSTKPVFGVSDKARLKPVSSVTETS